MTIAYREEGEKPVQ